MTRAVIRELFCPRAWLEAGAIGAALFTLFVVLACLRGAPL